jgi:AraC-like DNA-binding protein
MLFLNQEAIPAVEKLFDGISDILLFIKDIRARYLVVNQTLVERCGKRSKEEVLGKTTLEVYPEPLGERYYQQDLWVCTNNMPIISRLELHIYPTGDEGWCLTDKVPIHDLMGRVVGLAGVSRDLHMPRAEANLHELSSAVRMIQTRYAEALRVEKLADIAGLSVYQFKRRIQSIFKMTPGKLIAKTRIDAAGQLLRDTDLTVAEIAQRCGYCDQSALARQFKAACGLSPSEYRCRMTRQLMPITTGDHVGWGLPQHLMPHDMPS